MEGGPLGRIAAGSLGPRLPAYLLSAQLPPSRETMKDTLSPPAPSSTSFQAAAPARDYTVLVCVRGTVRRFQLPPGKPSTIGRSDKSDIVVALDTASRNH